MNMPSISSLKVNEFGNWKSNVLRQESGQFVLACNLGVEKTNEIWVPKNEPPKLTTVLNGLI